MRVLSIYTDGGSKGNPGPSSIGIVMYIEGKEVNRYQKHIGIATNNEAEYRALLTALEYVNSKLKHTLAPDSIECYSDSTLMVNQTNGRFKVKNSKIREFIMKIRILEQEIGLPIKYIHIPRKENRVADTLVNQG